MWDKCLDKKSEISIVIPCFKSPGTLRDVVCEIQKVLEGYIFEIILVLDGPMSETKVVAESLLNEYSNMKVVELSKNFGQHPAIFAGIKEAQYNLILTLDDDGQHIPSEIPKLLIALDEQTDIVYGVPITEEHSFLRSASSRVFKYLIFKALGIEHAKQISAFRFFRLSLLNEIELSKLSVGVLDVAIQWNCGGVKAVPVTMMKRREGNSNYTFKLLLKFAIGMILNYSIKPLKIALYLGFFSFIISLGLSIFYLSLYLRGESKVAGFTTLAILVSGLASIQLVTLGILGEYIGNIHQRTIGKPLFSVRSVKNS
jgi:undecaprenyl-phosphate 4-deoxy-4-formamido-L-arabinose transferase